MNKLTQISSCLLDLRQLIEKKTSQEHLEFTVFELKIFREASKIDSAFFEKLFRNKKLIKSKEYIDSYSIALINDIKIFIEFYKLKSIELDRLDKEVIVQKKIFYFKKLSDLAYKYLVQASHTRDSIINKIEGSYYVFIENSEMVVLRRKEKNAIKIHKELNRIYLDTYNNYQSKQEEYSMFTDFVFENIYNELNKITDIINSYKYKVEYSADNPKNILDLERIGIICRFAKEYLVHGLSENEFEDRLKLKNIEIKNIYKNKKQGELSCVVEKVLKTVPITKEKIEQWSKSFTRASGLSYSTFNNGSAKGSEKLVKELNEALAYFN